MRQDLEEALEILEELRAETRIIYVTNAQAMVLLMLDRLDEARPLVQHLLELGWRRPDFMELAERKGALPEPMPPPLDIDLSLPSRIQAYLESLPPVPLPWEPGGEEALEAALARWQAEAPEADSEGSAGP
ncbi:MAG: hypothetical protein MI919_12065 [Holophagales bacterium]|nr:hypothetical protein [Holophagales bacterium]